MAEEKDEEISIDFGKIKSFFKRDKKASASKEDHHSQIKPVEHHAQDKPVQEHHHVEHRPAEHKESHHVSHKHSDSDDEVSFDFSKVKSFFKNIGKSDSHKRSAEPGEESVDIGAAINFVKKYHIVLLLLIPLFLSIFLRMQTVYLPVTDQWAESTVQNMIKTDIANMVNSQHPNLVDEQKNKIIDDEYQKIIKSGKIQVPTQDGGVREYPLKDIISQYSASFKEQFRDDKTGHTYLLELDPYFWMRHARNILDRGHPGDTLVDGKPYDTYMLAPLGRQIPNDFFHAYFEAYTYKIVRIFNPDLDFMVYCFYMPILLCALAVIPAFFIARRLGGTIGGLFASVLVAIHPSFLTRTVGGFADTDPYNVLFPLLITWCFIEAFEAATLKRTIILAALAGFFTGLYSFAWMGWWYVFDFILVSMGIYVLYQLFVHKDKITKGFQAVYSIMPLRNTIILGLVLVASSACFVLLFSGSGNLLMPVQGPFAIISIHEVAVEKVWPNVHTTVAEQNEATFTDIVNSMGGTILFLICLAGIILTMIRKDEHGKIDVKYAAFLTVWFIGTIYGSTKGLRFTLLMVPAFSIAFGIAVGIFYKHLSDWVSKELKINVIITKAITIIICAFLLLGMWNSAKVTAQSEIPLINDAWYNSLQKVNLEAEPDAIINSWWDYGHWFKAVGNRSVTFDGTSQDTPQAHWIGKTLVTSDEDVAVGILRMLDCGATNAFDELDKVIVDTERSVSILDEIMLLDKEDARAVLEKEGLDDEVASVLKNTHCTPPQNIFITSEDMVSKSGVWAHFGTWNFEKAQIYYEMKKLKDDKVKSIQYMKDRFAYSDEKAEDTFFEIQALSTEREVNDWIAPWPGYASGAMPCVNKDGSAICQVGMAVNLTDYEAVFQTKDGAKYPNSIVYTDDGEVKVKEFSGDTIGYSVALIPVGDSYQTILMSPELAGSMFTVLFFFEGHGLTHFDKFSDVRDVTGQRIMIWKVDWEGKDPNVMSALVKANVTDVGNVTDGKAVEKVDKKVSKNSTAGNTSSEKPSSITNDSEEANNSSGAPIIVGIV